TGTFPATYCFFANPDEGNPAAPIPITVMVTVDPNIHIIGQALVVAPVPPPPDTEEPGQQTTGNGETDITVLETTPGEGLGGVYIDTSFKGPVLVFPRSTVETEAIVSS